MKLFIGGLAPQILVGFFSRSPQKNAEKKVHDGGGPSIALGAKLEGLCEKNPTSLYEQSLLVISNIESVAFKVC
jgi:hypothetical protein